MGIPHLYFLFDFNKIVFLFSHKFIIIYSYYEYSKKYSSLWLVLICLWGQGGGERIILKAIVIKPSYYKYKNIYTKLMTFDFNMSKRERVEKGY
jgi:hypothetical protein